MAADVGRDVDRRRRSRWVPQPRCPPGSPGRGCSCRDRSTASRLGSRHPLPTSSSSTSRTASRPTTRGALVVRSSRSPRRASGRGCASAMPRPTNGARMSRCCAAPTSSPASCSRRSSRPSTCDAPSTHSTAPCRSSRSSRAHAASRRRSRSPRRPGVVRLAFGSGDFRRDTGAADDPLALLFARSRLVTASRAAGLPGPIDGPTVSRDAAVLAEASRHAASVGMTGRLCLREEQVVGGERRPQPLGARSWRGRSTCSRRSSAAASATAATCRASPGPRRCSTRPRRSASSTDAAGSHVSDYAG